MTYNTKYLTEKHGQQILKDFNDLFSRHFWNLTDIGKKYSFTRERARQIFKKLYGKGYGEIKAEKKIKRHQEYNVCSLYLPPRIETLLFKLKNERLPIKKMPNGRFEINGHIIRFYQASAVGYAQRSASKYFRAGLWYDDFDFGIVKCAGDFYIVPRDEFSFEPALKRFVLYIRASPYIDKSKAGKKRRDISKYKEAWHLLRE